MLLKGLLEADLLDDIGDGVLGQLAGDLVQVLADHPVYDGLGGVFEVPTGTCGEGFIDWVVFCGHLQDGLSDDVAALFLDHAVC